MSSSIVMIPQNPANVLLPPAGKQTFFLDSTDDNRPKRKDENGTVVDIGSSPYIKVTKLFSDFSDPSTSKILNGPVIPPGHEVVAAVVKHSVAFAGGSITAYTIGVGSANQPPAYILPFDVFQAPGATVLDHFNDGKIEDWDNPVNTEITGTSTGDNLDAASAGSVDIYFLIEQIKR